MQAHYRRKGFISTLENHGIPVDSTLIVEGDLTQRSGREVAAQLLDISERPTAIAACNDLMALGAMSAAQERAHPPLTTVRQPIYQIGSMVCKMLVNVIRGEQIAEQQVILQPSLVVRQSTGNFNPGERG